MRNNTLRTAKQEKGGESVGGLRWYAVNTHPNSETRAVTNLERQGWHCFCPNIARSSRYGRRVTTRMKPLFPGYVFIHLDTATSRWRAIDSSSGVRGIVKVGEQPAPLPEGIVEALIAMTDSGGKVTFASTLEEGDSVRFVAGPLTGMIGRLEQLDASGRVTVLMQLLGRDTPIRGYASEVAPSSSA